MSTETNDINVIPKNWIPGKTKRSRGLWLASLVALLVVLVGVWRGNDTAAVIALVAVHAGVALLAGFDPPWAQKKKTWPRRVLRTFYVLGLALGLAVVFGKSNAPVRVMVMVVLCGLHAVALSSIMTLLGHIPRTWRKFSRNQLIGTAFVAVLSVLACVKADLKPGCGEATECDPARLFEAFGIGPAVYTAWVGVALVLTAAVTLNYLNPRMQHMQTPSLSALAGLVGFVVGSFLLIMSVLVTAWWRNNEPVGGPSLHLLPEIASIDGDYVALGDSYSAGEGLRPFEAFTESDTARLGNGCHRSQSAYSQLLRFAAPTPAKRFVACSGAVTNDIFKSYTNDDHKGHKLVVPPQVEGGEHPEVGLVTITIGGNDVVFSGVVTHCFLRTNCMKSEFDAPPDNPDRGIKLPEDQALDTWAPAAIEIVKTKVEALYPQLRVAYPNARIIVIGYPYLFPDRQPTLLNLTDCQTILRRFNHDERVEVRDLQDDLNQVLHDTAAASDIEFVSPAAGWDEHEPCGKSGEQYTNSIKPFIISATIGFAPGDGGTFHPNDAGQRELARLVTCYLIANPEQRELTAGDKPPGSPENPVPDCTQE